jgi:hypothetical protein
MKFEKGGKMLLFESFLWWLAPESDTNLYKFTWAPRNVVLSSQEVQQKFVQEDL